MIQCVYNNLPYSEKRDLIERRFHKSAKRKHEIKIIIQKEKHAQYTLVSFYWKIQTETDDKEAAWSGDAEAQNRLGHRYFYGNGTERDIVQAIHWYRESAKGGCEAGMLHLAEYYKNRKQYKEAVVPSICRSKNQVAERTPWMIVLRGGVIYLHIMNVSKRKECEYDRSI